MKSMPSLERRVAALEQELIELKSRGNNGRVKDWRRTVGIFTDNPEMKRLLDEAMKLRESDRRKARRRNRRRSAL
jgi:hypothetical protein